LTHFHVETTDKKTPASVYFAGVLKINVWLRRGHIGYFENQDHIFEQPVITES